jgi:hypothetical protein
MSFSSFVRLGKQLQPQLNLLPRRHCSSCISLPPKTFSTSTISRSHSHRPFSTTMAKDKQNGDHSVAAKQTGEQEDAHQYQAGGTTHHEKDQWKHREPYRVHDKAENFDVKWEGGCHCGKVTYQLSRDKPLASKYCHCSTCQRLHGVSSHTSLRAPFTLVRKSNADMHCVV